MKLKPVKWCKMCDFFVTDYRNVRLSTTQAAHSTNYTRTQLVMRTGDANVAKTDMKAHM